MTIEEKKILIRLSESNNIFGFSAKKCLQGEFDVKEVISMCVEHCQIAYLRTPWSKELILELNAWGEEHGMGKTNQDAIEFIKNTLI